MGTGKMAAYPLHRAYLYISGGCNLRCAHCWITPRYIKGRQSVPDGITAADVRKIIDEGRPLGLFHLKLTGGEPFTNPDIFRIIEMIRSSGMSTFIETNGTLIDRETALFLKKNGIGSVSVSIDSHRASFHDGFRGSDGAQKRAAAGIEKLVAEGIGVQVIMSLVRENASDIEGLVELARRIGAQSVKINPVTPIGRGGTLIDRGQTLPAEELIDLCRWVEGELSTAYGIETFFTIPSALKSIGHLFDGRNSQCRILNIIGILSDGSISICGVGREEPDLVMGNIRTDDLGEVWRKSEVFARLREVVPHRMEGICGRCLMAGLCLGSCRADAYVLAGSLAAPHWICQEAYERGLFPESRIREP